MSETIAKWFALAIVACVCLSGSTLSIAKTRYSGPFDYERFEPSSVYFRGHAAAEIAHLCDTGEHASTEDLEECGHREFELADQDLSKELAVVASSVRKNDDTYAKPEGEPVAWPSFVKAQKSWRDYRDSYCYAGAYDMGEAAEKYIRFWYCMAGITKSRVEELKHFDGD